MNIEELAGAICKMYIDEDPDPISKMDALMKEHGGYARAVEYDDDDVLFVVRIVKDDRWADVCRYGPDPSPVVVLDVDDDDVTPAFEEAMK